MTSSALLLVPADGLSRGTRSAIKHLLDGADPEAGRDAGAVTHYERRPRVMENQTPGRAKS